MEHLCRGDVFLVDDGLRLLIKWSKTIQARERTLVIPVLAIPGHPLCPRSAYEDMVAAIPASKNKPLFSLPGGKPLTTHQYTTRLRSILTTCGLESKDYSPHSFRRGGATLAFESDVDPLLIKSQGDWQSDAYLQYIDLSVQHRLQLSRALVKAVTDTELQ